MNMQTLKIRLGRLAVVAVVAFLTFPAAPAWAQSTVTIEAADPPAHRLHIENGAAEVSAAQPGWYSAKWVVEPVAGSSNVRFRNAWKGTHLNIETGAVQSSEVRPAWASAQWALERTGTGGAYFIRNVWMGTYLGRQGSKLVVATLDKGNRQFHWQVPGYGRTEVETVASLPVRTVEFRHTIGGGVEAKLVVLRAERLLDNNPVATTSTITSGATSATVGGTDAGAELDVQVLSPLADLKASQGGPWHTLYAGRVKANASNHYCLQLVGDLRVPRVETCAGTVATEAQSAKLQSAAAFVSYLTLDYLQQKPDGSQARKVIRTDDLLADMTRKLYLPRDAVVGAMHTMTIMGVAIPAPKVFEADLDGNRSVNACYKVWGNLFVAKASPCSLPASARTITFKSGGAFTARLSVTYYVRDGAGNELDKRVQTNWLEFNSHETIAVPASTSTRPIDVVVHYETIPSAKQLPVIKVPSGFTGDLCFKTEGTVFSPNASTCTGQVGDISSDTRSIRFQNDAGYDAEMVVVYFEDKVINGKTVPMPQTVSSGVISGVVGRFRLLPIPKKTSAGQPITVSLAGTATVKNNIFSTTLDANFAAEPQPCFKVWGTLFAPTGGKCW